MPGIHEDSKSQSDPVEASPSNEHNTQEMNTEEEQPTRETDQTDKLNKFLLKSFLQHINTQPMTSPSESDEQESGESTADWN